MPLGIKLQRRGRSSVVVTLAPADAANDPFGNRRGLVCKLLRSYPVSHEQFEFMDKLNAGFFTPYPGMKISLPYVGERSRRELIASDGTLARGYRLAFKHYPNDLKRTCKTALEELTAETLRFIKQIMWFFNLSHLNDPLRHVSLYVIRVAVIFTLSNTHTGSSVVAGRTTLFGVMIVVVSSLHFGRRDRRSP